MGVSVLISTLDAACPDQCCRLFEEWLEMGPIGGIFRLAMVLRDCLFENQNVRNFQEAAAPKYWGTKNLDKASREYCSADLRW